MIETIRHASLAVVAASTQLAAYLFNTVAALFLTFAVSLSAFSNVVELATQSVSLIVILTTAAYHGYHYFVRTEEDIRQDQIDTVLKKIAEQELNRRKRGKQVAEEDDTESRSSDSTGS